MIDEMKLAKALVAIKDNLPELYKYTIYFLLKNQQLQASRNEIFCEHFILEVSTPPTKTSLTIDFHSLIGIIFTCENYIEENCHNSLIATEEIFSDINKMNARHENIIVDSPISIQ